MKNRLLRFSWILWWVLCVGWNENSMNDHLNRHNAKKTSSFWLKEWCACFTLNLSRALNQRRNRRELVQVMKRSFGPYHDFFTSCKKRKTLKTSNRRSTPIRYRWNPFPSTKVFSIGHYAKQGLIWQHFQGEIHPRHAPLLDQAECVDYSLHGDVDFILVQGSSQEDDKGILLLCAW